MNNLYQSNQFFMDNQQEDINDLFFKNYSSFEFEEFQGMSCKPESSFVPPVYDENRPHFIPETFKENTYLFTTQSNNIGELIKYDCISEELHKIEIKEDANPRSPENSSGVKNNSKSNISTPGSSDKSQGKDNANIVKNYIPITSNSFAHFIMEDDRPAVEDIIYQAVRENSPVEEYNQTRALVLDYIKKKIFGKKNHTNQEKTSTSRQYKLRSKKQMEEVFHDSPKDSEQVLLIKKILRIMMAKFIDSQVYTEWLEKDYAPKSIVNKKFLSDPYNREQIKNVYTCHKFRPSFK